MGINPNSSFFVACVLGLVLLAFRPAAAQKLTVSTESRALFVDTRTMTEANRVAFATLARKANRQPVRWVSAEGA